MIDNIDDMTATAFRQAYGVPIVTLGATRETLNMEREALREVYGDTWRTDLDEWLNDTSDNEAEQEEPITESDYRAYGRRMTVELVDCLED